MIDETPHSLQNSIANPILLNNKEYPCKLSIDKFPEPFNGRTDATANN